MKTQIHQERRKTFPTRQLSIGLAVLARDYTKKNKCLSGTVQAKTSPLSYKIKVGSNRI